MLAALCFLFPETKGLSLEEIPGLFGETVAVLDNSEKVEVNHIEDKSA